MTAVPEARKATFQDRLPLSQHIVRHLRLAVPVMAARAGLIVMVSVDSIMTGRAGAEQLAHYTISLAPHITLLVIGIGLMVGTIVLTAQADGAGRTEDCGPIWSTSFQIAGALGPVTGLILLWGEPIPLLFGQSPELARGGGRALLMFAAGMPAILMCVATTFFLEGIGRPKAGMTIALSANLLNAALNWILIYGNLGAPEMGAAGAALATLITRWVMLAALVGYALTMPDRARYGVRVAARLGLPRGERDQGGRRLFRVLRHAPADGRRQRHSRPARTARRAGLWRLRLQSEHHGQQRPEPAPDAGHLLRQDPRLGQRQPHLRVRTLRAQRRRARHQRPRHGERGRRGVSFDRELGRARQHHHQWRCQGLAQRGCGRAAARNSLLSRPEFDGERGPQVHWRRRNGSRQCALFPNQTVHFSGGSELESSEAMIIADKIEFSGNTEVEIESAAGTSNPLLAQATLVE